MKLRSLFALALLAIAAGVPGQSELFLSEEIFKTGVKSGSVHPGPCSITIKVDAAPTSGVTMLKVVASKGAERFASAAVPLTRQAYYEMTVSGLATSRTSYALALESGNGVTTMSTPLAKVTLDARKGDNKYTVPDVVSVLDPQRTDGDSDSLSVLIDEEIEQRLDKLALQGASAQQINKAKQLARAAVRAALVRFYNRQVRDEEALEKQRLTRKDRRKTIDTKVE